MFKKMDLVHVVKVLFDMLVMFYFVVLSVFEFAFSLLSCLPLNDEGQDINRTMETVIQNQGLPVEIHEVCTEDGYYLRLFRIPNKGKPPVLLVHGLLCCSHDYVNNDRHNSIGFILFDAGYDVWLANVRGSSYSRRHRSLSTSSKEYWDFSFSEMGQYDLPAFIDHILTETKKSSLVYIGHSQGTAMAFALLSENADYNRKISKFIALAPVASLANIKSPVRYLCPLYKIGLFLTNLFGIHALFPDYMTVISTFRLKVRQLFLRIIVMDMLFLPCGIHPQQYIQNRWQSYLNHSPAGSSVKCINHFAQLILSKKFQKYDYGATKNEEVYNQASAPEYNLACIRTPVYLIWSVDDWFSDQLDIEWLQEKLTCRRESHQVTTPHFSHVHFVWGADDAREVHQRILHYLREN